MNLRPIRPTLFALALLVPALSGCTGAEEDEVVDSSSDEIRALKPEDILGEIAYGETKTVTVATTKYRALRFRGKAGEEVSAAISSSVSRFAGLLIVDQTFKKSLATVAPQPGALELNASAKLPSDGTYYVVFRQTTSSSVTHNVSLTKAAAPPREGATFDFGLSQTFEVRTDPGFATATFTARVGERYRISVRPNNSISGSDRGNSKATISGCVERDLGLGLSWRTSTDVEIATTGTCTISMGGLFPAGGVRSYHLAVVRLDDPERAAYIRGIECDGPEISLNELGNTMPAGSTRMYLQPTSAAGRRRSCNPSTGCSPYETVTTFGEGYYLETTKDGVSLRVTSTGNTLATGHVNQDGVALRAKATATCLSIVGDAPDVDLDDRAIRFAVSAAERPPADPAFTPECTGAPLSDAAVLQTFAPGSSLKSIHFDTQQSRHTCNRYTGCEAWSDVTSSSSEYDLTVQNGKLTLTWGGTKLDVTDGIILQAGKPVGRVTASCAGFTSEREGSIGADGRFNLVRYRYSAPAL